MDTHPIPKKKHENQTAADQLEALEAELEVHPCVWEVGVVETLLRLMEEILPVEVGSSFSH